MKSLKVSLICLPLAVALSMVLPRVAVAALASKAWAGPSAMLSADAAKKGAVRKQSPTRAIKELDAMLDEFKTGQNLTPQQEAHNRDLKMKIIHGTFDVRELSKLSLAKHWSGLTPAQRNHFVDLMVSLLEEKALFSKEQSAAKSKKGGKYYVRYRGYKYLSKDKKKSFVRTKIILPGENIDIDLNYKLRRQDGEWKIYDVIVDEASLVANYKYQFNSIITKHSYDELVGRMTRKLNEIKADRAEKNSKS